MAPQVLTGQFADKPTRSQSSRRLVNLRTSQLAGSKFLQITELLHYICTLNLTLDLIWIWKVIGKLPGGISRNPDPNPIKYRQCTNSIRNHT